MGIFDGMNESATGSGRKYLDPGEYRIKIIKIGQKTATDSFKGLPAFFTEFEVVESTVRSCPAGTLASWSAVFKAGEPGKMAIANVKQFLAAALGSMTIFDMIDPATGVKFAAVPVAEAACGPSQPFAGKLLGVRVNLKKTRQLTDFSKHDWFPLV